MAQKIIIVTGTPGVGKTKLAQGIGKRTGLPVLGFSEFVKKNRLYTDFDRKRLSYVVDEQKVRQRLKSLTKQATDGLVIDTHIVDQLIPKNVKPTVIVLRLDPMILSRRLRRRGWKKSKVWENVESELIDLSLFDAIQAFGIRKLHEIDSTGKSASTLLSLALRIISQSKPTQHGRVNWLAKYDPIEVARRL
ncbi:MAG TPA: adenylate kinase family protein [Candidatus Bathyarchaeia archaeon]|nr:adenylate kinase family protein [Candidatus Bathyarchaeia archaeon]